MPFVALLNWPSPSWGIGDPAYVPSNPKLSAARSFSTLLPSPLRLQFPLRFLFVSFRDPLPGTVLLAVLGNVGLNDEALRHLARLSCLRRLHLRSCRSVTDSAVRELMAALPRLQHFELNGCWGVAMQTMDELYGRPLAEWRRAEDVARAEALLSADDVDGDSSAQEKY